MVGSGHSGSRVKRVKRRASMPGRRARPAVCACFSARNRAHRGFQGSRSEDHMERLRPEGLCYKYTGMSTTPLHESLDKLALHLGLQAKQDYLDALGPGLNMLAEVVSGALRRNLREALGSTLLPQIHSMMKSGSVGHPVTPLQQDPLPGLDGLNGLILEITKFCGPHPEDHLSTKPSSFDSFEGQLYHTITLRAIDQQTCFDGQLARAALEAKERKASFDGQLTAASGQGSDNKAEFEDRKIKTDFESKDWEARFEVQMAKASLEARERRISFDGRLEIAKGNISNMKAHFEGRIYQSEMEARNREARFNVQMAKTVLEARERRISFDGQLATAASFMKSQIEGQLLQSDQEARTRKASFDSQLAAAKGESSYMKAEFEDQIRKSTLEATDRQAEFDVLLAKATSDAMERRVSFDGHLSKAKNDSSAMNAKFKEQINKAELDAVDRRAIFDCHLAEISMEADEMKGIVYDMFPSHIAERIIVGGGSERSCGKVTRSPSGSSRMSLGQRPALSPHQASGLSSSDFSAGFANSKSLSCLTRRKSVPYEFPSTRDISPSALMKESKPSRMRSDLSDVFDDILRRSSPGGGSEPCTSTNLIFDKLDCGPPGISVPTAFDSFANIPLEPSSESFSSQLAESHSCVTIFFSDLIGFSSWASTLPPSVVMETLNDLYSRFDDILMIEMTSLYKVETIGDSYMVASNLTMKHPGHAATMIRFALRAQEEAAKVPSPDSNDGSCLKMRIARASGPFPLVGIHSGPAMSGIVGKLRKRFCLFGDTVNMASRTETSCPSECIQITEATRDLAAPFLPPRVRLRERGMVEVKGSAKPIRMFLADSLDGPMGSDL